MIKVLFALFTVSALLLRTAAAAADFRMSPSCGGPRIAAGELPERDAALRTVRRFYEEYLAAWEGDRRKQEEVCERYVARSLREEIRAAQAAGLDYDPYVQAQDCGPETLARLRVECDSADCSRCRVFLWDLSLIHI